jgi:hypothetical protein
MNNINFGRVIPGGLVAGLILNIGEFLLNEVLFVKQMEEMFRRMNLPRPGAAFIITAVGITFLLGIVMVCLYAMIRTRDCVGADRPRPKSSRVYKYHIERRRDR